MPISPDETILASADEFIKSQSCGRTTPLFPASGPATRSFNGLHPKSKFLVIQSRLSAAAVRDGWISDWEKDHGRAERRRLARVDLDQDISPFPGARQLIRSTPRVERRKKRRA